MKAFTATALALAAPATALLRFPCAQLVIDRLDPLVTPGQAPSPHLHQILGGNSFNVTMDPEKDMPGESTCTSCQFSEDFSNYWTAVLYFKARNGTYKRVPQIPNSGFNGVNGGMTVYYMQDGLYNFQQTSKVQAFQPGFRMFIGDVNARTKEEAERFRQLTFTCLDNINTRDPQTLDFPTQPCKTGIMTAVRFPTCWDGDTSKFNNKADWPEDGSQPFVWSFGDGTGYANHGDYLFGWQGDALQRALDSPCYQNCPTLKTQNAAAMNKCTVPHVVKEEIDAWVSELPGGHQAQYVKKRWAE
ncbi:unnamed protein product [Alternaria alternata]